MKKSLFSSSGLVLLAIFFLAVVFISTNILPRLRIDLTENKIYTLANGSKDILQSIDEPLNFYFFYSKKIANNNPALSNYAKYVITLLEEYIDYANGKINLTIIDPIPFSEEEDKAASFGLQSASTQQGDIYFGLVGTNAVGDQQALSFIGIQETFLEYEISKLIDNLVKPTKPIVGLVSGLDVIGGFSPASYQETSPWIMLSQIQQMYDVRKLEKDIDSISDDIDVLMLIQPSYVSEKLLFAIDQFVLRGGKIVFFIDPIPERAHPYHHPATPMTPAEIIKGFNVLFTAWGISIEDKVLGDAQLGLVLQQPGQMPEQHLTLLDLDAGQMAASDVATRNLESIIVSTIGAIKKQDGSTTEFIPLLNSSSDTELYTADKIQVQHNLGDLRADFSSTNRVFTLAARIQGAAKSAFPKGREGFETILTKSDNINIVVVADTDILSDGLWVSQQTYDGQAYLEPFTDNANFVINILDNFSGSSALINVRSRGNFHRPFDVVDKLKKVAQERFATKQQELLQRLQETEQRLIELQQQKKENNLLVLSPQEESAIENFLQEKLQIRKQLRDVQFNLDEDIEKLGARIKIISIGAVPLLLTMIVLFIVFIKGRREKMRALIHE